MDIKKADERPLQVDRLKDFHLLSTNPNGSAAIKLITAPDLRQHTRYEGAINTMTIDTLYLQCCSYLDQHDQQHLREYLQYVLMDYSQAELEEATAAEIIRHAEKLHAWDAQASTIPVAALLQ